MKNHWSNLPEKFLARLDDIVDPAEKKKILESFMRSKPTTFRINRLKTTKEAIRKIFDDADIRITPVSWYDDAFIVRAASMRQITSLPAYTKGLFYVQSLSSMIPALVLDPQPGETILDLCAAPGSKTTQMAMLMGDTGSIIANDNSKIRSYKLEANLKMQGVKHTTTTNIAGQIFWETHPEQFDRTLVDVPCSMEGRFDTNDPKSYQWWSPGKIKELSEKQKWLLRSAVSSTKPGGVIVYSTCTLAPEENECVIDWIIRKEKGAVEIMSIDLPNCPSSEGLSSYRDKPFDPHMGRTLRIFPTDLMEGFFVAKLRKTKSTVRG